MPNVFTLELELKPRKVIDMKQVKCVCFHYDTNAPTKSKKANQNDKTRFDIYTDNAILNIKQDNRVGSLSGQEWVAIL